MQKKKLTLLTLVAAIIPLAAAQNNTLTGRPFQSGIQTIVEIINNPRVQTLIAKTKVILKDILDNALDYLTFILATSSNCEGKQVGPVKRLMKNVPKFVINLFTGRWKASSEAFSKLFPSLFALIQKVYVKLTTLQKLIKFLVSLFTNIIKLFTLFYNFVSQNEL